MINSFFQKKLDQIKLNKVTEVALKLNIDPNWLLAVMYFETARTLSPQITNSIGSVGLIQFTHDPNTPNHKKIAGKTYSLGYIKSLNFVQQMDLVYLYFKPYSGKMKNFLDVYLVTIFPLALNESDAFVLKTKNLSASLIARQNSVFDLDKNKQITRGEIKAFFAKYFTPKLFKEIQGTNNTFVILAFFLSFFY